MRSHACNSKAIHRTRLNSGAANAASIGAAACAAEAGTDLDVTVQELSRVHVLQGFEQLVHDVLFVHVLQDVCADDGVEVRLHVLEHQVQVPVVFCFENVE